ncbi:MAG: polysaccharide biosynthesis C-terminal domain-containing protein [Bacteroidales bacterium]|nr:polysaccharide biosynthesis C-terminal domain-containing protein [Bacteroidales bacterium]
MSSTNSLKKLFSDSMIYGLSSIVGRFLNYLLVPLYTYTLVSSGNYGVVTNLYAYTALFLVLLTFGMETTFFYFANNNKERYETVFSTALYMVGGVALLFLIVIYAFIGPIAGAAGYADHPEYVRIMATIVAFDAFQAILFAFLRFKGRAWKFAFLKLLFIFCNIGINLFVFLAAPKLAVSHPDMMGWYNADRQVYYIFLTNLICTLPITLAFLPELRLMKHCVDWSLVRQMLRYTWPLLLLGLAGILNQVADKICYRFIIPGPEGDAQLGIYGACVKIAMIMAMITQAFRYAYEPFVFSEGKESKESQALVMKYFVMFTLLAFLAVVGYMDILRNIISERYWEGLRVVPIVMMAEIFMGIYFNLSFWYKLIAKTWWGAILSGIGCAVLLAVNFIFVPRYGYIACAWGGFCGYGVCMLLSYFIGQHYNPIHYPVKSILGYFAVALAIFAAMNCVKFPSEWLTLTVNTLLILVYLGVVLYNERALVNKIIKKLKG